MRNSRGLSFDDMLDALGNVKRRRVLVSLMKHNSGEEPEIDITSFYGESGSTQQAIAMEHAHLPKLDSYGLIEWERETNEIAKGPYFKEVKPLLELFNNNEDELPDDFLPDDFLQDSMS